MVVNTWIWRVQEPLGLRLRVLVACLCVCVYLLRAVMAASSVNNISANFGSCSPTSSSSCSAPVAHVQPAPSVTWNPQLNLRSCLKTSFVGLYGPAGPKRSHFTSCAPPLRSRSFPGTCRAATCALAVGDKLPDATLSYIDKEGNVQIVEVSALTKGKKVVIFAVPGAFTPTCSQKHLPGFVEHADEMKAKGVDTIACIAVNDVFVLRAWAESQGVGDKVLLLSDGNGHFTRSMGVTLDLSDKPVGLGLRSKRYSLLAEDGIIKLFNLEDGGAFSVSAAEDILKVL